MNVLLTGMPGVGKTTLIHSVVEKLDRPARGFTTAEIREGGRRRGFKIATLDGQEGILAHETIAGSPRVSRYGVSTADLEAIGIPAITPHDPSEIIILDEIGKMECVSEPFKDAAWRALDAPNLVLGTIARKGTGFIARVKQRPDVQLFEVTRGNRDQLVADILRLLAAERSS
jgi:nucleoside-triphosphatase